MKSHNKEMLIKFAEAISSQFAELHEELDAQKELTKHLLQRINKLEGNGLANIDARKLNKLLGLTNE